MRGLVEHEDHGSRRRIVTRLERDLAGERLVSSMRLTHSTDARRSPSVSRASQARLSPGSGRGTSRGYGSAARQVPRTARAPPAGRDRERGHRRDSAGTPGRGRPHGPHGTAGRAWRVELPTLEPRELRLGHPDAARRFRLADPQLPSRGPELAGALEDEPSSVCRARVAGTLSGRHVVESAEVPLSPRNSGRGQSLADCTVPPRDAIAAQRLVHSALAGSTERPSRSAGRSARDGTVRLGGRVEGAGERGGPAAAGRRVSRRSRRPPPRGGGPWHGDRRLRGRTG